VALLPAFQIIKNMKLLGGIPEAEYMFSFTHTSSEIRLDLFWQLSDATKLT
jgi:hypothetical protein